MRGNLQYCRPTSVSLPIIHADTDAGRTTADVGRTPETRVKPQYDRPMSVGPTHGCGHYSLVVGQVAGGVFTTMQGPTPAETAGGDKRSSWEL